MQTRFLWKGIASSPFLLVQWYSPSLSLWRSFTWMLLEHRSVGEGGVSARVLTALFWDYVTKSSAGVQSEQARRATSVIFGQFTSRLWKNYTTKKGDTRAPLTGWYTEQDNLLQDDIQASWHRARYELTQSTFYLLNYY